MIREATAMKLRQNLGQLLSEVEYRQDSVLITKGGKPVAALVDVGLFQKIRALRGEFDRLVDELGQAYQGVPEETAQAEIGKAIRAARRK